METETKTITPRTNKVCSSKKEALGKPRLAEKVFEYVVHNIRNGIFHQGQKVTEKILSQQIGISHVPVREALEKLQQHGWIDRLPQRGAYIRRFDDKEIELVSQVREIIECGAVSIVAGVSTQKHWDELKNILDKLYSSLEKRDPDVFEEMDILFHTRIVDFVENERLSGLFHSFVLQSSGFYMKEAVKASFIWFDNLKKSGDLMSHKNIYDAIVAHDSEKAEELVRQHIRNGRQLAIWVRNSRELVNGTGIHK